jgi:manganese/zinc/iron transport system permease protein
MTAQYEQRVWLGIGVWGAVLILLIPMTIIGLGIRYDYTLQVVMVGAGILGLVSGVLGTFAVLRKQSLLGDTLAHAALPGVAIAFLIAGRELVWLLVGAGIAGWLTTLFIQALLRTTRIKQDAAMGIALTVMFGLGVSLLGYIQGREDASRAGLKTFIFGQAAAMSQDDVVLIGLVTLGIVGLVLAFWKEFKLITFDMAFARTNGYPVQFLDILLSTLIVVGIVLGLQLAGVILMVGLLIAPAVAARQWTNRLGQMVILAAIIGAFAGISGTLISAAQTGLPTGPLIIIMASLQVVVSILFAPGRGLIWQRWQAHRDQRDFSSEQVLQDIFELASDHEDMAYRVPHGMLKGLRGKIVERGLKELQASGWIAGNVVNGWQLTSAGIAQAHNLAKNRQLWQLYRLNREGLGLPLVAEDWRKPIADMLPPEALAKLEQLGQESKQNQAAG